MGKAITTCSHGLPSILSRSIRYQPIVLYANIFDMPGANLSASGDYAMPPDGPRRAYLEYIEVKGNAARSRGAVAYNFTPV